MKFCIDCKFLKPVGKGHDPLCLRDWHDPVTGEPIKYGGPLKAWNARQSHCGNGSASGFEPKEETKSPCPG